MFLNLDLSDSESLAIEMAASMVQFDAAWEIDALAKLGAGTLPGPPPLRAQLSAPDELIALHDAIDERRVISLFTEDKSVRLNPYWCSGAKEVGMSTHTKGRFPKTLKWNAYKAQFPLAKKILLRNDLAHS